MFELIRAQRERQRHSESSYFRNLLHACHRNDPTECYTWLLRWLGRWLPGQSLEDFLAVSKDQELKTEVNNLGQTIFSASSMQSVWRGGGLAVNLQKVRKSRRKGAAKIEHLPLMNPRR